MDDKRSAAPGAAPRLSVLDAFATEDEVRHVLRLADDEAALRSRGIDVKRDETGFSCELPVEGDPVLQALEQRMQQAAGLQNHFPGLLRFRRYAPGEYHPLHSDSYESGGLTLAATALLYLTDVEQGGETHFPRALPDPVKVAPRRARLVTWRSLDEAGALDPHAVHESLAVVQGSKATVTSFLYVRREISPSGLRFVCINDRVPAETTDLLRAACEKRGVEYLEVDAPSFDFAPERQLEPGDLLYRPAVSLAAQRVEQFLWDERVATFYADAAGPFFECLAPVLRFERAGLPVPRTFHVHSRDRELLRGHVASLGGFPVVLKMPGGEGGVGVLRADSFAALFSLVDYALSQGSSPLLCAFVDQAVHHRVVVVGERAVATYRNVEETDDFRTFAPDSPAEYSAEVPPRLAKLAVGAARALRREFAGVDILQHPSGRLYVLEANFPCYHPQAERAAGIDVSGAMVEHLAAKALGLKAQAAQAGEPT